MPHPINNQMVGLIVIETPDTTGDMPTVDFASHDGTLGALLDWLSHGHRGRDGDTERTNDTLESDAGASPRPGLLRHAARFPRRQGHALVAADCRGLDAQLHRALKGLRRKIAAAT
jgi:hypothetical protein